jgi:uncharacterized protein YlxW (UPF0749 family)
MAVSFLFVVTLLSTLYYRGEMISAKHEYAISQSQLSQERLNNDNLRNEIKNQNEQIQKLGDDTKTYQAKLDELNLKNSAAITALDNDASTPLQMPATQNDGEILQWMRKKALELQ